MPNCFVGLTALTTLGLFECGLAAIPPAITNLEGSLQSLALPHNQHLQLGDNDLTILLTLRKLRKLDVQKMSFRMAFKDGDIAAADAVTAHLNYAPPLWSPCSFQHLMQLPVAFFAQHGRVLAVDV